MNGSIGFSLFPTDLFDCNMNTTLSALALLMMTSEPASSMTRRHVHNWILALWVDASLIRWFVRIIECHDKKNGTCAVYIYSTLPNKKQKQTRQIYFLYSLFFSILSSVSRLSYTHTTGHKKRKKRRKNNSQRAMIDACESNFSNGGKNEENARGTTAGRVDQESGKWNVK